MLFKSTVTSIGDHDITVQGDEGEERLANDFVLALTGFHPDRHFLTTNRHYDGSLRDTRLQ